MLKKSLVILLTLLITLSFCNVAYAAPDTEKSIKEEEGEYQVLWTYICIVTNWMDINAYGQASMASTILAYDGVERVMMNNYLQRLVDGTWTTVKRWSNTYYDSEGSWMQTWYVTSGYNYRLRTYFYAFDGLASESTTLNSGTVYY